MGMLIAYNDAPTEELSGFFEFCAEEIDNTCQINNIITTLLTPPQLRYASLASILENHTVCVIAAHGDERSIANEINEDIVSIGTDNRIFRRKLLYAISCSCAKELKNNLEENGLASFWGYSKKFNVWSGYVQYAQCAISGILSLIEGKTIKEAREIMLSEYDSAIAELASTESNPFVAANLLDNKESLVITGDENLTLKDLNQE